MSSDRVEGMVAKCPSRSKAPARHGCEDAGLGVAQTHLCLSSTSDLRVTKTFSSLKAKMGNHFKS